ncbi:MAG: hydrogenase maturation nickel metallochaperone HypA [Desulfomonilaceae bacterium]|nr:hydrogenase maturation nickel metallochaperone HypA [Desulfomonilaceae bacterium]
MHEMGIVQSILEIVEQQAKLHEAEKVVGIKLEFGALTGVMPASIDFAFEVLSKGGIAEGAGLNIVIVPIKVFCFDCSKEIVLEHYQPTCPICDSAALKILEGRDEMRIAELVVE